MIVKYKHTYNMNLFDVNRETDKDLREISHKKHRIGLNSLNLEKLST